MSESDEQRGEPKSEADRTLLGVAPPRFEGTALSAPRSPVLVRAGDSVGDVEPPRVALPSRPPAAAFSSSPSVAAADNAGSRAVRLARAQPVLWMVAAPAFAALAVIGLAVATAPTPVPKPSEPAAIPTIAAPTATPEAPEKSSPLPSLAELEAKPPGSLSAAELLRLAEGKRAERQREVEALRAKVVQNPALLADKAVQAELLQATHDAQTAPQALSALSAVGTPLGADLLYEVWTGTTARTDATELSRALLYSADVRSQASPALSVALELRAAETCEQFKSALPHALKDGDKRSLHLLGKLVQRRGCGPKKAADCYPCLRAENEELVATINAAKSRRAPTFPAP